MQEYYLIIKQKKTINNVIKFTIRQFTNFAKLKISLNILLLNAAIVKALCFENFFVNYHYHIEN